MNDATVKSVGKGVGMSALDEADTPLGRDSKVCVCVCVCVCVLTGAWDEFQPSVVFSREALRVHKVEDKVGLPIVPSPNNMFLCNVILYVESVCEYLCTHCIIMYFTEQVSVSHY